jgi:Coenzyme PQQ synthesis protein D (PqqD)
VSFVSEAVSGAVSYVRDGAAVWRRCLDGVLVLGATMPDPVMLPSPGDVIWELLASPRTAADLVAALADRYETSTDVIEHDLLPFLGELESAGLVLEPTPGRPRQSRS